MSVERSLFPPVGFMDWNCDMEIATPRYGRPPCDYSVGKCNGTSHEQQIVFERLQVNETVAT
jgi:hypothetical protein